MNQYLFIFGIMFGIAMSEVVTKMGGPIFKIETPLWFDILVAITALITSIYILWKTK